MPAQRSLFRWPALPSLAAMLGVGLMVSMAAATIDAPKPSNAASAADLAAAAEELVKALEPAVSNATSFKQGADEVEHKGYIIALIANAVSEADGDAKWKGNALSVRDAALGLAKAKSQPNADKALKEIKGLLGGGSGGAGKAMKPLEVISLEHLMKEVNERKRPMTKNLRGAQFGRSKETIARDAQVWALLAAAARTDTTSAEKAKKPQADFEKFADDFFNHAKSLAAAASKGDQNVANDALKAVNTACSACHAVFRPDADN